MTVTLTTVDVVLNVPLFAVSVKLRVIEAAPGSKVGAVNVVFDEAGSDSVLVLSVPLFTVSVKLRVVEAAPASKVGAVSDRPG